MSDYMDLHTHLLVHAADVVRHDDTLADTLDVVDRLLVEAARFERSRGQSYADGPTAELLVNRANRLSDIARVVSILHAECDAGVA